MAFILKHLYQYQEGTTYPQPVHGMQNSTNKISFVAISGPDDPFIWRLPFWLAFLNVS